MRRKNGSSPWFEKAAFDYDLIAQNTQFVQTLKQTLISEVATIVGSLYYVGEKNGVISALVL